MCFSFDILSKLQPLLVEIRRHLHRHAEISWKEEATADYVFRTLSSWGLAPYRVANTGVVCDILPSDTSAQMKKFVALRADMDALPITEETGLEFVSVNKSAMHACGHDGHTAWLLGAAYLLLYHKDLLSAPVRLIFQPAEEICEGAKEMITQGALNNVLFIFGGHVDNRYEVGEVVVQQGSVNASSDRFLITLTCDGGHAARPHQTQDLVVTACSLVTSLQCIISRLIDPGEPAVLSVSRINAGTSHNILPKTAEIEGTIRTNNHQVREKIQAEIKHYVHSISALYRVTGKVDYKLGPPPLINSDVMIRFVHDCFQEIQQENMSGVRVHPVPLRAVNMGAEDFADYLTHFKGCFLRFGASLNDGVSRSAHSPTFDFDERVLGIAAITLAVLAIRVGRHVHETQENSSSNNTNFGASTRNFGNDIEEQPHPSGG